MTLKLESVYFGDIVEDPSEPTVWCAPLAVAALTGHCLFGVEEAFRDAKYGSNWPDRYYYPPDDLKATSKVTKSAVKILGFEITEAPGCSLLGVSWSEWLDARPAELFNAPMLVSLATDRPVGHVVAVQGNSIVETRHYGLMRPVDKADFPGALVVGTYVLSRQNSHRTHADEPLRVAA